MILRADERGGRVAVYSEETSSAALDTMEQGGVVMAKGKDGTSMSVLAIDEEHGGQVITTDRYGRHSTK